MEWWLLTGRTLTPDFYPKTIGGYDADRTRDQLDAIEPLYHWATYPAWDDGRTQMPRTSFVQPSTTILDSMIIKIIVKIIL